MPSMKSALAMVMMMKDRLRDHRAAWAMIAHHPARALPENPVPA